MFISETHFTVRYAETDQMGIVHHSNYPIWFEAGRTDFIRKMGMPYSSIEKEGLMLPLLELKCKFQAPARYEDEVVVKTWIKEATYTRLTFSYEVIKAGENEILTLGETMHVWTNRDLKPVNIKKNAPHIYELIMECMKLGD
ncbi:acyl-CoA thioesterase [Clostridium thermosuccinogenes]|uniref:acyl-CoA thioesterase n=1 Tax=Clostridium thermosuccinogenes TaxID=84032 RepID=UPI000CCC29C5|nr:thioesterase family protein [Pseudoclostridium thermosuccinogenes]PNT93299.1 4-hydroxybenzoyl-CoA thioesterase [Pseudoclostridium thermosuccinogenes]